MQIFVKRITGKTITLDVKSTINIRFLHLLTFQTPIFI